MLRRGALLSLFALAPLASPALVSAQIVASPQNNFHVAVNGMMALCPVLVGGGPVPDAAAAAPYGLRPITAPAGEHRFESLLRDGALQVWFAPSEHRCMTHYNGAGFHAIAGVARDFAAQNSFSRILTDTRGSSLGEVFERPMADPAQRERFTIAEDSASQTTTVSFSKRTIN